MTLKIITIMELVVCSPKSNLFSRFWENHHRRLLRSCSTIVFSSLLNTPPLIITKTDLTTIQI